MSAAISLNEQMLNIVELNYSTLDLPVTMEQVINLVAQVYSRYIPMPKNAIRGYLVMGLKDFQSRCEKNINQIRNLPSYEQNEMNSLIADIIYEKMTEALVNNGDQIHLRNSIDESLKVFENGNLLMVFVRHFLSYQDHS